MRIVVFGDTHVHNYKRFSTIDDRGRNTRVVTSLSAIRSVRKYCEENDIKKAFHLGDVFEARGTIKADVFNDTFTELEKFKIKGIELGILVGNHDLITKNTAFVTDMGIVKRNMLETMRTICSVIIEPGFLGYIGDYMISGIPFSDNTEDIERAIGNFDRKSLVLGHIGTWNTEIGEGGFAIEEGVPVELLKDFPMVLLGHYHERQQIDGTNIRFIGALTQQKFGEKYQKRGFGVVEVNDSGGLDYKFVPVKSPKFVTFELDHDVEVTKEKVAGNFVRVTGKETDFNTTFKEELIDLGAKSVIFNTVQEAQETVRVPIKIDMSAGEMVDGYVDKFGEDFDLSKLKEIGKNIIKSCS